MAEQFTTTIDGVKYNTADINKDPVLKARYEYLSYDPKGNLLRTAEKNLAKAIENGWTQDIIEGKALVAKYKGAEASFSSTSQKPINPDDVTVSPYARESVSQFPKPGETVGDLFTNASNGATYNWKTGALVHDPSGNAIASGQGGSNNPLPTAQAPNNPANINQATSVNLPTNTPGMGNISNAAASSAGATSNIETQEQITKDRAAEVKANQDALEKETAPLLKKLLGGNSPAEAREDAQDETGINPENYFAEQKSKIAEIETLTTDYNKEKAAMEAAIFAQQDRMATTGNIAGGVAKIQRDYAPKLNMMSANINAKAATLQALQGNFNTAQDFVNQAVQDATAEQKYNMDLYSTFYQINRETIESLDEPYKKAYESALKMSEVAYEQAVNDKTMVGEMMIDPALRGSGITITDTLDQAFAKASRVAGSNYVASQNLIHGGTSGGGGGGGSGPGGSGDDSGDENITKFTPAQQKTYEAYKSQIGTYDDKEEALKELDKVKFGVIKSIGQPGYDLLVNDVNSSTLPEKEESFWNKLIGWINPFD